MRLLESGDQPLFFFSVQTTHTCFREPLEASYAAVVEGMNVSLSVRRGRGGFGERERDRRAHIYGQTAIWAGFLERFLGKIRNNE